MFNFLLKLTLAQNIYMLMQTGLIGFLMYCRVYS